MTQYDIGKNKIEKSGNEGRSRGNQDGNGRMDRQKLI